LLAGIGLAMSQSLPTCCLPGSQVA
jgi:hypothetical protein